MLSGLVGLSPSPLAAPVRAQSADKDVAAGIIAAVEAKWAAGNMKVTAEAMKSVAEDHTEVNGDYATRLDVKALNVRITEASDKDSGRTLLSEMAMRRCRCTAARPSSPTATSA